MPTYLTLEFKKDCGMFKKGKQYTFHYTKVKQYTRYGYAVVTGH